MHRIRSEFYALSCPTSLGYHIFLIKVKKAFLIFSLWGNKRPRKVPVFRERTIGKQGKRYTLAIFAAPPGPQKCLLGLLPKPATSGQNVQK